MGYITHEAVLVTTRDIRPGGLPDIEAFRASLPESLRPLVVGPIPSAVNGYVSYVFLPSGSKVGWRAAEETAGHQKRFAALFANRFEDGSTFDDVIGLTYGADYRSEHGAPDAEYLHIEESDL